MLSAGVLALMMVFSGVAMWALPSTGTPLSTTAQPAFVSRKADSQAVLSTVAQDGTTDNLRRIKDEGENSFKYTTSGTSSDVTNQTTGAASNANPPTSTTASQEPVPTVAPAPANPAPEPTEPTPSPTPATPPATSPNDTGTTPPPDPTPTQPTDDEPLTR